MLKKGLKNRVLNALAKRLLNHITVDDILKMSPDGGIIYRGKRLSKEDVDILRSEAEYLNNSKALRLVLKDMQFLAQKAMFDKSQTYDDLMFGKAILYTVDILDKKIKNLAK